MTISSVCVGESRDVVYNKVKGRYGYHVVPVRDVRTVKPLRILGVCLCTGDSSILTGPGNVGIQHRR